MRLKHFVFDYIENNSQVTNILTREVFTYHCVLGIQHAFVKFVKTITLTSTIDEVTSLTKVNPP